MCLLYKAVRSWPPPYLFPTIHHQEGPTPNRLVFFPSTEGICSRTSLTPTSPQNIKASSPFLPTSSLLSLEPPLCDMLFVMGQHSIPPPFFLVTIFHCPLRNIPPLHPFRWHHLWRWPTPNCQEMNLWLKLDQSHSFRKRNFKSIQKSKTVGTELFQCGPSKDCPFLPDFCGS